VAVDAAPFAIVPSAQLTAVPAALNAHGPSGVTEMGITPDGNVTTSDTLVAASGPPLLTVAV
jgi:hypothetical protein